MTPSGHRANSPLGVGEDQPVKDSREIAQVEDVVKLGWGGRQVLHDVCVKCQSAACQPVTHSHDALVKHLEKEDAPQMPPCGPSTRLLLEGNQAPAAMRMGRESTRPSDRRRHRGRRAPVTGNARVREIQRREAGQWLPGAGGCGGMTAFRVTNASWN